MVIREGEHPNLTVTILPRAALGATLGNVPDRAGLPDAGYGDTGWVLVLTHDAHVVTCEVSALMVEASLADAGWVAVLSPTPRALPAPIGAEVRREPQRAHRPTRGGASSQHVPAGTFTQPDGQDNGITEPNTVSAVMLHAALLPAQTTWMEHGSGDRLVALLRDVAAASPGLISGRRVIRDSPLGHDRRR